MDHKKVMNNPKKKKPNTRLKKFVATKLAEALRSSNLSQSEVFESEKKARLEWQRMTENQKTEWLRLNFIPNHITPIKKTPTVEEEIVNRSYKTGLNRKTATDLFLDSLFWNEKDENPLPERRWVIIVLSADCYGETKIAAEMVAILMERGKIVSEMRMKTPKTVGNQLEVEKDYQWDPECAQSVNKTCIILTKFCIDCTYIFVPSHQQAGLMEILNLMKETRDRLHGRDTKSIRFDRLVCIEDAASVIRKYMKVEPGPDSKGWERLAEKANRMQTIEYGRSVADHFAKSTRITSEDKKLRNGLWITVTMNGIRFSDPTIKETPIIVGGVCLNIPAGRAFGPPDIKKIGYKY